MSVKTKNEKEIPVNAILVEQNIVAGVIEYECYLEGEIKADNILKIKNDITNALIKSEKTENKKRDILSIKITSANNNEFDCDEISQQRIARKIIVMNDTEKTDWKLADDTIVKIKKEELIEVLKYAMIEQETIQLGL